MEKKRNPFISNLVVPYIAYVTDVKRLAAENEYYGYEVEATSHTRIYNTKKHRELIWSLSMYARDVFLAMQYFVQPGNSYVVINYTKMQALTPSVHLSPRRYADTIRELVKAALIDYKDSKAGEFWYDPQFFFAGNRLDAFPECAVKVATKHALPRKLRG